MDYYNRISTISSDYNSVNIMHRIIDLICLTWLLNTHGIYDKIFIGYISNKSIVEPYNQYTL